MQRASVDKIKRFSEKVSRNPIAMGGVAVVLMTGVGLLFLGRTQDSSEGAFPGFEAKQESGSSMEGWASDPAGSSLRYMGESAPEVAIPKDKEGAPDFNEALREISKKGKGPGKKKRKKSGGLLAAMTNLFGGGSSGGGGGASALSKPDAKALVKRKDVGPGSMYGVRGDRDYRSAYGGSGTRGTGGDAARAGGNVFGAASSSARGMLRRSRSGRSGPLLAEGGGEGMSGSGSDLMPPKGAPEADGKEVTKPKEEDKAEDPGSSDSGAKPGMPSMNMGGTGRKTQDSPRQDQGSGVKTGVSSRGLAGDARSGSKLGDGIQDASSAGHLKGGGSMERPEYSGDSVLKPLQDVRKEVGESAPYVPEGVDKLVADAKAVPMTPEAPGPTDIREGVTIPVGSMDRAQQLVTQAQTALGGAEQKLETYRTTLYDQAGSVGDRSREVVQLSDKLMEHNKALQNGVGALEQTGRQVKTLGAQWDAANVLQEPARTQQTTAVSNQANQAIRSYTAAHQPAKLAEDARSYVKDSKGLLQETKTTYQSAQTEFKKQRPQVGSALSSADSKIGALKSELDAAAVKLKGEPANSPGWRLYGNAAKVLEEYQGVQQSYRRAQNELFGASSGVERAGLALIEALSGPKKSD